MKNLILVTLLSISGSLAFAGGDGPSNTDNHAKTTGTTLCLESNDPSKAPFENEILTIRFLDLSGHNLLSVKTKVSATDSAPAGQVIKSYSQAENLQVAQIRYVQGTPSALVVTKAGEESEVGLSFNRKQTIAQGSSCFDLQK